MKVQLKHVRKEDERRVSRLFKRVRMLPYDQAAQQPRGCATYSMQSSLTYLVGLDSSNLLVGVDKVADLLVPLFQGTLSDRLGHLGNLDDLFAAHGRGEVPLGRKSGLLSTESESPLSGRSDESSSSDGRGDHTDGAASESETPGSANAGLSDGSREHVDGWGQQAMLYRVGDRMKR